MLSIPLANILLALAQVLHVALQIYWYVVLVAVLMSWLDPNPYNPVVRTIHTLTEPVLGFFRHNLPFLRLGPMDLSPIAVLLVIQFLQIALVKTLVDLAARMQP